MLDFSLPLLALLVNWGRVELRRQRRWHFRATLRHLRQGRLWLVWGLWTLVILSHLLGLVATVGSIPQPEASCSASRSPGVAGLGLVGLAVGLWVAGRDRHGATCPWTNWQVRWTLRRRRVSDPSTEPVLSLSKHSGQALTVNEWLALLPPGIGTLARLMDWLTRRQTVKYLAALPVLYPIWVELEVEALTLTSIAPPRPKSISAR